MAQGARPPELAQAAKHYRRVVEAGGQAVSVDESRALLAGVWLHEAGFAAAGHPAATGSKY
jgi:hypothetical protein